MDAFKILLVGEGGCGKSVWINRLLAEQTGNPLFEKKYVATLGVDVIPVKATSPTDGSQYIANIWDCAGQERFGGLGDGYYMQAQAVIFAFSLDSGFSLKRVSNYLRDVQRVTGPIPYIIVGMKSDVRTISEEAVRTYLGPHAYYVEICTKTGDNIHEPLRILHRQLRPSFATASAKL